jgi:hypothetical protein
VVDSSAKGISEKIINYLLSIGLDIAYLRGKCRFLTYCSYNNEVYRTNLGQGYDGFSVMSGNRWCSKTYF